VPIRLFNILQFNHWGSWNQKSIRDLQSEI